MPGWVNLPSGQEQHPYWEQWLVAFDVSIAFRVRARAMDPHLALPIFIAPRQRSYLNGTVFADRLPPNLPLFWATLPELRRAGQSAAFAPPNQQAFWRHLQNSFSDWLLDCHDRVSAASSRLPRRTVPFASNALDWEALLPFLHGVAGRLGLLTAADMSNLAARIGQHIAQLPLSLPSPPTARLDASPPGRAEERVEGRAVHQPSFVWCQAGNWQSGLRLLHALLPHLPPRSPAFIGSSPEELAQLPIWPPSAPLPRLSPKAYPLFSVSCLPSRPAPPERTSGPSPGGPPTLFPIPRG